HTHHHGSGAGLLLGPTVDCVTVPDITALNGPAREMTTLEIIEPGPLALIEDRGRPGYLEVGVGHSGAADRAAHALGARLLGNDADTAAIEVTMGGLVARAHGSIHLALTGASAPAAIDERQVAHATRLTLGDGQTLRLGLPAHGLRTYVSLRGGIDVTPVLGSRSTD